MDRSLYVGYLALRSCARGLLREGKWIYRIPHFSVLTRDFFCASQGAVSLVVRYHIAAPEDLNSDLRILLQLAAYHIEVLPLSSGKSGSVSGEVRC